MEQRGTDRNRQDCVSDVENCCIIKKFIDRKSLSKEQTGTDRNRQEKTGIDRNRQE